MDKNKDEILVKTFPKLYADRHGDLRNTCMVWGFSCGNGWYDLLYEMSEKLENIINTRPEWCEHCTNYENEHPHKAKWKDEEVVCTEYKPCWFKATQVKEKFGGLRVYMNYHDEEMDKIIKEAEQKASITCENCGQQGKLRENLSWWKTSCDTCDKK